MTSVIHLWHDGPLDSRCACAARWQDCRCAYLPVQAQPGPYDVAALWHGQLCPITPRPQSAVLCARCLLSGGWGGDQNGLVWGRSRSTRLVQRRLPWHGMQYVFKPLCRPREVVNALSPHGVWDLGLATLAWSCIWQIPCLRLGSWELRIGIGPIARRQHNKIHVVEDSHICSPS